MKNYKQGIKEKKQMNNNSKDITFVIVGLAITISIWAVYGFVMSNEQEFAGITLLLKIMLLMSQTYK